MATRDIGNLRTRLSWEDEGANRSLEGFRRDLKGLRSEMNLARSGGREYTKSLKGMREQSDILTRKLKTQGERVKELKHRYDESVKTKGEDANQTKELASQYNNATAQMNRTEKQLERLNQEIKRQESPWTKLGTNLDDVGKKMQDVGKGMKDFGKSYTKKVTAPIVAGGVAVFKASMDYESAFAGVRKTVNASETEFQKLSDEIREMSKVLPSSATEIANVAEMAGQLGIETESISSFTRTIIDLGEATNMSLEQAGSEFARFANIVGMSQSDFDKLGSVVVDLGNNLATTESEIVSMGMRLAGAGSQIGLTEAQIMAFSGALSSVGIEAEAGGSAFSKVMINMGLATERGGKELESFASVAQMSSSDFKKAFEQDASKAILSFIEGLGKAEEQGTSAIAILDEMGITEVRMRDALLRASGASDVFSESLKIGTKAWEENVALTEEAEERYATTESQLKIMWNRIKDVAITLGDALVPAFMSALDALEPMINKIEDGAQAFSEMDEEQQQSILKMIALAGAIGPVSVGLGGLTNTIGGTASGIGKLATAIGAKTAGKGLVGGLGALVGSAGPLALTAVGIAGITYAGIELHKHLSSDLIPEVDLFGDEVSKTTEKAVGSFMDLNNDATIQLKELSWSSREVSQEMADSLVTTFDEMGEKIVKALEEQRNESLQAVQDLFDGATDITVEEQEKILNEVNEGIDNRIKTVQEGNERIEEILSLASEERRQLTTKEENEINRIKDEMQSLAIEIMTQTQEEQKIILENMADQSERISKRQASEIIKNSIEAKEGVIQEADETYYNQKLTFEMLRDELGVLTAEQADDLIAEAKRQRDEIVENAEKSHSEVLDAAKENNPKIFKEVDRSTGEIIGGYERLRRDILKSNLGTYKDTENIWKQIRSIFTGSKIDFVKPSISSWYSLKSSAESIWGGVRNIFQRKISMPAPQMRQVSVQQKSSQMARFANNYKGTDFHPGGPSWLGEKGDELVRIGDKWSIASFGLYDLDRGAQVFTHEESKRILNALNNIPGYATGARPSNEANRIVGQLNQQTENKQKQPIILQVHVTSELDGRAVGESVAEVVTEVQERNQGVVTKFAT